MADCDRNTNWLTLYREAVQERDPKKLLARVVQARHAMRSRARELWYSGAPDTTERRQVDAASYHLQLLCTIEVTK